MYYNNYCVIGSCNISTSSYIGIQRLWHRTHRLLRRVFEWVRGVGRFGSLANCVFDCLVSPFNEAIYRRRHYAWSYVHTLYYAQYAALLPLRCNRWPSRRLDLQSTGSVMQLAGLHLRTQRKNRRPSRFSAHVHTQDSSSWCYRCP